MGHGIHNQGPRIPWPVIPGVARHYQVAVSLPCSYDLDVSDSDQCQRSTDIRPTRSHFGASFHHVDSCGAEHGTEWLTDWAGSCPVDSRLSA